MKVIFFLNILMRIKNLKKSKPFLIFFGFVLFFNLVAGAYLISNWTSSADYSIVGGSSSSPVVEDLEGFTLDVGIELTKTDTITLNNPNSPILMNYHLDTSSFLVTDPSCNGVGDIGYSLLLVETAEDIGNDEDFTLPTGTSTLEFTIDGRSANSCPRAGEILLDFTIV